MTFQDVLRVREELVTSGGEFGVRADLKRLDQAMTRLLKGVGTTRAVRAVLAAVEARRVHGLVTALQDVCYWLRETENEGGNWKDFVAEKRNGDVVACACERLRITEDELRVLLHSPEVRGPTGLAGAGGPNRIAVALLAYVKAFGSERTIYRRVNEVRNRIRGHIEKLRAEGKGTEIVSDAELEAMQRGIERSTSPRSGKVVSDADIRRLRNWIRTRGFKTRLAGRASKGRGVRRRRKRIVAGREGERGVNVDVA